MYGKMHGQFHNNQQYVGNITVLLVTYSGTLTQELRIRRNGNHMNNRQTRQTDESQMMTSRRSRTSQSHKSIAQTNRTNESHKQSRTKYADVMSKNGMTKRRLGCSRATQVCMEDLRLVNLTEKYVQIEGLDTSKLLVNTLDGDNSSQQSNKNCWPRKLTITHSFNNQTGRNCFYTGNTSRGAQQVKYVGNTIVFCFGFNFMSPKWTRTKLSFVVTPPQEA